MVVQLVVDAWINPREAPGGDDRPDERLDGERLRVNRDGVDDGTVVDQIPLKFDDERCALPERPAGISLDLAEEKWRLLHRVGAAGVPEVVAKVIVDGAVVSIRTGLGENLDASVAQLVVLGRE